MLLQVLLLLIPHTLCILHHLLLDAAKQTERHTHADSWSLDVDRRAPVIHQEEK